MILTPGRLSAQAAGCRRNYGARAETGSGERNQGLPNYRCACVRAGGCGCVRCGHWRRESLLSHSLCTTGGDGQRAPQPHKEKSHLEINRGAATAAVCGRTRRSLSWASTGVGARRASRWAGCRRS